MTRPVLWLVGIWLALWLPVSIAAAQGAAETEQEPQAASPALPTEQGSPETRRMLDAIREDLVELRFEKALAALEPLLSSPTLTDDERVEGLVLRSQTRAAFGDLDATEEDYRQILLRRPAWSPDASLTPRKAIDRFVSVRDQLIGRVNITLDPADATLWVDGREIAVTLEPLALLAGTHELRVARRGHDGLEQPIEVEAGTLVQTTLTLMPNARTVVVRSEPADVEIWLDGELAGTTRPVERFAGISAAAAELVIEDVPIGEHQFEFRKPCYRTERMTDAVNIDLLDRAPKRYKTVRLLEAQVEFRPSGGPDGAELLIDGKRVAVLPTDSVQACPGERNVEVLYAGRSIWSERRSLIEGKSHPLAIHPRPNLALVGQQEFPREFSTLRAHVNLRTFSGTVPTDPGDPAAWSALELESGTDLVLGASAGDRQGVAPTWWLYSPVLRSVARLTEAPAAEAPVWTVRKWGLQVVDDDAPLVMEVSETLKSGPQVGSRLLSVGGREIGSNRDLYRALAAAGNSIDARWEAPDGEAVDGMLNSWQSPRLRDRLEGAVPDALRAAWAVVASESGSSDAPAALANLALLFAAYGEHDLALRTWRRVRWPQRAGIGSGTVDYYVGRELQALGRDREAIEALRRAAAGSATAQDDLGPSVAPAARDRLADLGQSP